MGSREVRHPVRESPSRANACNPPLKPARCVAGSKLRGPSCAARARSPWRAATVQNNPRRRSGVQLKRPQAAGHSWAPIPIISISRSTDALTRRSTSSSRPLRRHRRFLESQTKARRVPRVQTMSDLTPQIGARARAILTEPNGKESGPRASLAAQARSPPRARHRRRLATAAAGSPDRHRSAGAVTWRPGRGAQLATGSGSGLT